MQSNCGKIVQLLLGFDTPGTCGRILLTEVWKRLASCREAFEGLDLYGRDERFEQLLDELRSTAREGEAREAQRDALLREVILVLSCCQGRPVLELIMDAVIRLSGAQRGFLLLSRRDGSQEIVAARNLERTSVASPTAEISRRVVGTVLSKNRPVRLADARHTEPFSLAESVTRLKLLSVLCAPIHVEGTSVGAVYLENRTASGIFTEESEHLITEFADHIGMAILNAQAHEGLRRSCEELQAALEREYGFEGVVGHNADVREALRVVAVAAKSDIPVLIQGESGTGKELLARAVHQRSPRRDGPFISVNCAALPRSLLESELFGHTRGAFTGAVNVRRGLFAAAHDGTLFLDEIGEMAPELQAKLLRVLQSGEFRPLGSDRTFHTNARIVAATQRDILEDIKEGRFRQDLFFRLNGVCVKLPPLRERREDIPLFIDRFLKKFAPPEQEVSLDAAARACLMAHDYPGNVRELETIIRRSVLFARGGKIGLEALPPEVVAFQSAGWRMRLPVSVPRNAQELLLAKKRARSAAAAELERAFLRDALAAAHGRPGEAARFVGMNRSQFARMLSRHGLSRCEGRSKGKATTG